MFRVNEMEAIIFYKMSLRIHKTTRCPISEDNNFNVHICENLMLFMKYSFLKADSEV
jgi:hypothetical protein